MKCFNKHIIIIIIFTLLYPFFVFAQEKDLCSSNGYTISTINGMLTNEQRARENRDNLKKVLFPTYKNEPVEINYLLNPSHIGGAGDTVDVIVQKITENAVVSDYDLTELIKDASQKVKTQKLLLVAHSQGNFYANSFLNSITGLNKLPPQSFGIYGVASPASYVWGIGAKYITSSTDAVINKIRFSNILDVLPANVDIDLSKDIGSNGHSFSDVYLRYQSKRMVEEIEKSLDGLMPNATQPSDKPCIPTPKITLLHKITGSTLAFLDHPVDTTQNSINRFASSMVGGMEVLVSLFKNNDLAMNNPATAVLGTETENTQGETQNVAEENSSPVVKEEIKKEGEKEPESVSTTEPVVENIIPQDTTSLYIPTPLGSGGMSHGFGPRPVQVVDDTPSVDNTPPVISLIGSAFEVVAKNFIYTDAGATALDDVDGVVSVITSGAVDTSVAGIYNIIYTASDVALNTATKIRQVMVDEGAKLNRPNHVTVAGDYAYVVSELSNSLEIIDISNPAMLVHKGSAVHRVNDFEMFAPKAVAVSGNYAYVVSYSNALEVVDISNPILPVHRSTLLHGDGGAQLIRPNFINIVGDYAYIISYGGQNVEIVNISNPANPVHVSSYSLGALSVPSSLAISSDFMYVTFSVIGQSSGGLQIVNISNKAAPVLLGVLNDGAGDATISSPRSVFVSGDYAYIASWDTRALEIVDISDPHNPTHKSKLTAGFSDPGPFTPNYIAVVGDHVFITSSVGETLEIIDVSDRANPVYKSSLANGVGGASISSPTSVFISGNYAYISSSMGNALEIVDISDLNNPIHKNKLSDGEYIH